MSTSLRKPPKADAGRTIRWLWSLLPAVPCPTGCSDCCAGGPPAVSAWERDAIPEHLRTLSRDAKLIVDTEARTVTLSDCPFRTKGGCQIYPHRPLVCRVMGAVQGPVCRCPRGISASNPLTFEELLTIVDAYRAASPKITTPTFILPGGRVVKNSPIAKTLPG